MKALRIVVMVFAAPGKLDKLRVVEFLNLQGSSSAPDFQVDQKDSVREWIDDERLSRLLLIISNKSKNDSQQLQNECFTLVLCNIK